MAFTFKAATKSGVLLRMALDGVTGGGKTFTLLEILTYLADPKRDRADRSTKEKVAVIDTERSSSLKYANIFGFQHGALTAPYSPQAYIEAIRSAADAGFPVLGIDSLTHAWEGPGGVLEIKDNASRRQGVNDFTAWRDVTPLHNALVNTILDYPGHVVVTMRSKTAYAMTEYQKDGATRTKVEKVGLKPIQREGMEYEFDIVADMTDPDTNTLLITKTRCPELRGATEREPGPDFTQRILDWLSDAEPLATSVEKDAIKASFKELGDAAADVKAWAAGAGVNFQAMTKSEAEEVLSRLSKVTPTDREEGADDSPTAPSAPSTEPETKEATA